MRVEDLVSGESYIVFGEVMTYGGIAPGYSYDSYNFFAEGSSDRGAFRLSASDVCYGVAKTTVTKGKNMTSKKPQEITIKLTKQELTDAYMTMMAALGYDLKGYVFKNLSPWGVDAASFTFKLNAEQK